MRFSERFASLLEGCGVLGRRPKSPIAMGEIPFEKSVSARIFHIMKKNSKIPAFFAGIFCFDVKNRPIRLGRFFSSAFLICLKFVRTTIKMRND